MTLHYGFDSLPEMLRTVVTVGSFDGVHAGHRVLLERLVAMARRLLAESVVVTFDPHPRIAMGRAEGLTLLTSIEERALLLERYGVDRVIVAHFDEAFRKQPYEQFVRESLIERAGMVGMVVGYNHRFGQGSEGNYERLLPLGELLGFGVERVEQFTEHGAKVSSTVVRNLFECGDMVRASEIMGHGYIVAGEVQQGVLRVKNSYKLLPANGCYRALVNEREMQVCVENRSITMCEDVSGGVVVEFLGAE